MNRSLMALALSLALTGTALADGTTYAQPTTIEDFGPGPEAMALVKAGHDIYVVKAFRDPSDCQSWFYLPPYFEDAGPITRKLERYTSYNGERHCTDRVRFVNSYRFKVVAPRLSAETLEQLKRSIVASSSRLDVRAACPGGITAAGLKLSPFKFAPVQTDRGASHITWVSTQGEGFVDLAAPFEVSAAIDPTSPVLEPAFGDALAATQGIVDAGSVSVPTPSRELGKVRLRVLVKNHRGLQTTALEPRSSQLYSQELECARARYLLHAPATAGGFLDVGEPVPIPQDCARAAPGDGATYCEAAQ